MIKAPCTQSPLVSICIPTYNRCSLIVALLSELDQVTSFFFEVIVVNDGSEDETASQIDALSTSTHYHLRVLHQANSGRATALKNAVMAANGEYVILMDDDDKFIIPQLNRLEDDLKSCLGGIETERSIGGLVYLCSDMDTGQLIGSEFPEDNFISNLISLRADHGVTGDKKEVIQRRVLQEIMYTVPSGESRMPTSVLWARVAKTHDVICKNNTLVKKQYLPEGLSKNVTRNRVKNPVSSMMGYFEIITMQTPLFSSPKYLLRNTINYFRFYFHLTRNYSLLYFLIAGSLGWAASVRDRLGLWLKK